MKKTSFFAFFVLFSASVAYALPPNKEDIDKVDQAGKAIKYDKAVGANPTAMPPDKAVAQKDIPRQINTIEKVSQQYPEEPEVQSKITETYIAVDEPQRALPHADKYVQIAQKSNDPVQVAKALDMRATVNFNLKNYPAAASDARAVLSNNPDDKAARQILALTAGRSMADLTNAQQAPPSDDLKGAPAAQDKDVSKVMSTARQNAEVRTQSTAHDDAQRYLGLGDYPAAINSVNVALNKFPNNAPLLALRSQAELGEHKPNDALTDAKAAVLSAPKLPEAYLARAKAEEALSYPDPQIIADYTLAKDLDPRFTPDYESALARLHGAAAASANNPNAQVDANGIGMAGRKGLGFNPQAARDQLFGGLPEPVRKFAPIAIILFMAGLIVAISAWLKRQSPQ